MNNTTVGADLAKEVIQVCIYTNKKVHSNMAIFAHPPIWSNLAQRSRHNM